MEGTDRSGTSIGPYNLQRLLGRGGMGEVYVAEDTRLGRVVALKILRPEVAADHEHRARFEREAKALAALKHPGVVTIYALEQFGEDAFFVMDLVEGSTLTELIEKEGAMSVDRVLELAVPIADAIAAAHKQGIAHRDIKPDNIMVGTKGGVTVLDFGLAKNRGLQFSGLGGSTMGLTVEGRIFGTVNYMAPEQVEGSQTNLATDVFSLGVVLYEMATGSVPFRGESTVSILSSILKDQPIALSTYDNPLPDELDRLIHRCLEKDQDRRWQTALDVRNELELVQQQLAVGGRRAQAGGGRSRARLAWSTAAVFAATTALFASGAFGGGGSPSAQEEGRDECWTFQCLTSGAGMEHTPSLSPAEDYVAYSMRSSERNGEASIYLHRIGGNRPIELTADMVGDELAPRFSPKGDRIAFRSGRLGQPGSLYIMGATGESRRRLDVDGFAPDWSPDGRRIVCSTESYTEPHGRPTPGALVVIDVETGDSEQIYAGDAVDPRWSPNGEWILFWTVGVVDAEGRFQITGRRDIGVVRADGTEPRLVTDDLEFDWSPAWSDGGRKILFSSNRGGPMALWELDFDPETGALGDTPTPLPAPSSYAGDMDVSRDGRMIVYVDGMGTARVQRVQVDPETFELKGIPEVVVDGGVSGLFDVSPDGEQLVLSGGPMRKDDIYLGRSDGSGVHQITDDGFRNIQPRFTPDGKHLQFFSNRGGQYEGWQCRLDGGGGRVLTDGWRLITTPSVNPKDGSMAVVTAVTEDWYMLPADVEAQPLATAEPMPKVDDEGRWFSPIRFDRSGGRLLGAVQPPGEAGPMAQRWIGFYDMAAGRYEVVDLEIAHPFTLDWAPDMRRVVVGDRRGLWVFDPDAEELSQVLEFERLLQGAPDLRVTEDGQLYYSMSQNERDIWIARLDDAAPLERIGR